MHMTPTIPEAEARLALVRVLSCDSFAGAPQLSRFLQFVVVSTLEGQAERLKGYTIGVEALGRRPDFDPQADPIVRVEAIRLRAALRRYYEGEGASDPIVIEIPRGGYVPVFMRRDRRALALRLLKAIRAMQRLLRMQITVQLKLTDVKPRLPPLGAAATTAPISNRADRWPTSRTNPTS